MKLTFYGHATYSVEVNGKTFLFDPFFTGNPSVKNVDIDSIKADYLFITHGHGDHTGDLLRVAKKTGAQCVASAEIAGWLSKNGVERVHPLNHGGPKGFDFGKVRAVNAVHSSSFSDGSYAGNPLGFVFTTPGGNFYAAGDTALTMDMQLIPLWAKLEFAVLPIGGNYTMDPGDAIHASDFIKCNRIVGVHYNTWPIIAIDTDKAKADFKAAGKELLLPKPGETITL
ncbi:MAG TPA: metal-dependent hydrolase [Puia sp.]|uniref:metal-dependent hydrolase n=1 Tax=Puia sp. TaxID=2045100 RepID=UPI002D07DDF6|nr:metal-dependent hydrolase [Puia sp.]HVU95800.1 metal-dependent hydrolase [Puia sp.]